MSGHDRQRTLPNRDAQYEALKERAPTIGMLLAEGKRPAEVDGIGTIFLMSFKGWLYLVTALHNLEHLGPPEELTADCVRRDDTSVIEGGGPVLAGSNCGFRILVQANEV